MTHSDDQGLVLPPRLAPVQVAIVPIYKNEDQREAIAQKVEVLSKVLRNKDISVKFDDDDNKRPGWKFAEYEAKGVPVRVAIGPRDLENNNAEVARRDTREKDVVSWDGLELYIENLLTEIQANLLSRAHKFREENTTSVDTFDEFKQVIAGKGGFVSAHWDGTAATEQKIKEETKATIRCIPTDVQEETGTCVYSGEASAGRVLFAKAY